MKKISWIIFVFLFLFIGAESWILLDCAKTPYPDIASQLKNVQIDASRGTLLKFCNISIKGRNYSELLCRIKNGKARIISLKPEGDTLWIPNSLGPYPVKVIGGDWTELPEAVEYAKKYQKTPALGVLSWMKKDRKKYKAILMEEGICTVYAESFYGVKTEHLELPKSMLLLGALSFAESDIDEVVTKNHDICSEWGAFLGTKYQNKFHWTSPENRSDSMFADSEDGETYKTENIKTFS